MMRGEEFNNCYKTRLATAASFAAFASQSTAVAAGDTHFFAAHAGFMCAGIAVRARSAARSVLGFAGGVAPVFCARAGIGWIAGQVLGAGSIGGTQDTRSMVTAAAPGTGNNIVVGVATVFALSRCRAAISVISIGTADASRRTCPIVSRNDVLPTLATQYPGAFRAAIGTRDVVARFAESLRIGRTLLGLGWMHTVRLGYIAPTHALAALLQHALHRGGLPLRIGDGTAHQCRLQLGRCRIRNARRRQIARRESHSPAGFAVTHMSAGRCKRGGFASPGERHGRAVTQSLLQAAGIRTGQY